MERSWYARNQLIVTPWGRLAYLLGGPFGKLNFTLSYPFQ